MNNQDIIWTDKSANYIPFIVSGTFIFLGVIAFFDETELSKKIAAILISLLLSISSYLYFYFFASETKPLIVKKQGLLLTEDNQKFFKKKQLVKFEDITSIKIGRDKSGGNGMEFIYVKTKNKKSYFNVIFEVTKFKEIIEKLTDLNINDSEPYRLLPKKLR